VDHPRGRHGGGLNLAAADVSPDAARLLARCAAHCRFPPPGTPVVCAVSGGADSLALLVLAVHAGCAVTAVHVDHGLRPGSAAEAAVVEAAARRFGAAFRSERVSVEAGANLEARARAARYAVLPPDVLTGHTADDRAETVLLHLLRGSGLAGLAAMADDPRRPMLALRRRDTEHLTEALGLRVVHDPSNADPAHRRNRVRHELLPLLADIGGRDPVPLLVRQADLLAEVDRFVRAEADRLDVTSARALREAPTALARAAVRSWLTTAGVGGGYPPDAATVARVLAVAAGAASAAEVGGGWRVTRTRGLLSLHPPGARMLAMAASADPPSAPASGAPVGPRAAGTDDAAASLADARALVAADPHLGEVVVGPDALRTRIAELGAEITADYHDRAPLLVGVLKGAFMFMADLARAIELPVEFDFMAVASYGNATRSSGVVRIVKDLDLDLSGRHVLIVEDIIDSGLTLAYLRKNLAARNPASVEVCALLVREGLQAQDPGLRYVGFRIPPDFVVGYGLDVGERYRGLPYIASYVEDPQ
jgi:hypoxanthine phosphoribosyltransferase